MSIIRSLLGAPEFADDYQAPWGGHGVFPNIYRDMRHPRKYGKSLWVTYIFTVRREIKSLNCLVVLTPLVLS